MTLPAAAHTTTAAADDLVALFKASQAEHDNLRHEHAATQRRLKDAEAALHEREQTVKHQEAAAKRSSELIASLRETVQTYIGACALQAEAAEVGGGAAAGGGGGGGEDAARRAAEADERERRLETQLAARNADVSALRAALAEAEKARCRAQELEAETNRSVGSSAASTARQGAPDELKVMLGGLLGKDPKDSYAAWLGFK